jgi:NitT/TauT family transport system substrate-binding protein
MVQKRKIIFIATLLLVFLVLGAWGCSKQNSQELETPVQNEKPEQPAREKDKVILQLNWLPTEYPVTYVSLEKDFWAEQNLDVEIIRGYGSADTAAKIATKNAEFGMIDMGTLVLSKTNEHLKIKAVANYHTYHPAGVIVRADSGINSPKDLEGKKIVTTASSAYRFFWPAYCKAQGIDESKVELLLVDPVLQEPTFVKGEADGWLSDNQIIPVLKSLGIEGKFFPYKSDGKLDRYGDSIIVHEDTLTQNPDLVRRFVAGFVKGIKYSVEHPEEAVAIWKKHVPEIDQELFLKVWEEDIAANVMISDESRAHGIGWMSEDKVRKTIESVIDAYNLEQAIAPEEVYTTEFLPEEPVYP